MIYAYIYVVYHKKTNNKKIFVLLSGVDPNIMGIGPADAIRKLLSKTGMTLEDMDLVDVSFHREFQFLFFVNRNLLKKKCEIYM